VTSPANVCRWPVPSLDASVAGTRYAAGATTRNCDGHCCASGVSVDLTERDRILAHATLIEAAMDAAEGRDPARWFDAQIREDADFPSGHAVRTGLRKGACVFLDARKRCVLHAFSDATGLVLKPFFCRAFPMTIEQGIAVLDPDAALRPLACCGIAAGGPSNVLEVCPDEMRLVLGPDGVADLQRQLAG
jgi:Fe-S-cluster containining protein